MCHFCTGQILLQMTSWNHEQPYLISTNLYMLRQRACYWSDFSLLACHGELTLSEGKHSLYCRFKQGEWAAHAQRPWLFNGFQGLFFFLLINSFIFNWRIIALQYCVSFCRTSAWISHRYTNVSLPLEPPSHLPPHPTPLGCHRALGLVPCVIKQQGKGF